MDAAGTASGEAQHAAIAGWLIHTSADGAGCAELSQRFNGQQLRRPDRALTI